MNNAKSIIYGSLYDFLRETRPIVKSEAQQQDLLELAAIEKSSDKPKYNNESYLKIAPIIPKNFNFVIKAATFSAVKENSQNDFSAKLQLFSVSLFCS